MGGGTGEATAGLEARNFSRLLTYSMVFRHTVEKKRQKRDACPVEIAEP